MTSTRLVILGLLLLVAAATRWWLISLQDQPAALPIPVVRSDYRLQTFNLWTAREDGSVEYHLSGTQMTQNGDTGMAEITQPVLELRELAANSSTTVGTLSAPSATIDHASSQIMLNGPTKLELTDQLITTQDVVVDQLEQTATSTASARIDRARDWLTGKGLAVDFNSQQVQLHAEVVAFFAARESTP